MIKTVADAREAAWFAGEAVVFVAPDGHGEPTVWVWQPDANDPEALVRRVDIPAGVREVGWQALTGHLPIVTD
jgi:hypothetical protein